MRRGGLFRRFFLVTAGTLLVACAVLLAHLYTLQRRALVSEWRADLKQEAEWLGLHVDEESVVALAEAWRITHSTTRVTAFDEEWALIADSHDEPLGPELEEGIEAWKRAEAPTGLVAVSPMRGGGWVVMSRPTPPGLAPALRWETAVAVLGVLGLVAVVVFLFARSLSVDLRKMGVVVDEVAAGRYGETLDFRREDELGDLARAFDAMSTALADGERLRTRLLHDVSHELRSPLGRIRVLAETAERKPERLARSLEGIAREVELLDRIVGDLLRSAHPGAELGADQPRTSLLGWAREASAQFGAEVEARGVNWRAELPADDVEVLMDRQRLTQAAGNLVDNALRAVRDVDSPRIDVKVAVEGDHWSITVADNGEGIAPEHLEHVFRRFYRVEAHRDREDGGVGLGLSLVRAIARAHGGTASIESEPGRGTRVRLELPVAP